jgi:cell division protein FtsB
MKFKRYIVVLALGVVIVGFLGDNSVLAHLKNKQRKNEFTEEINKYLSLTLHNQEWLHQLRTDPKAVDQIAREWYFMKKADEDVFVLSDDDQTDPTFYDDGTVE